MGTARPLAKLNAMTDQEKIRSLERRLQRERNLRKKAEARIQTAENNSRRFHALLLRERIRHIKGDTP